MNGFRFLTVEEVLVFLDWHGIEVDEPGEELYHAMIQLAEKHLDKAGLASLFTRLSKSSQE